MGFTINMVMAVCFKIAVNINVSDRIRLPADVTRGFPGVAKACWLWHHALAEAKVAC